MLAPLRCVRGYYDGYSWSARCLPIGNFFPPLLAAWKWVGPKLGLPAGRFELKLEVGRWKRCNCLLPSAAGNLGCIKGVKTLFAAISGCEAFGCLDSSSREQLILILPM
ncbi:hypothetical protein Nepgr_020475 [Nepenthes gracilis]|uniref:Uncharacterized protein n=1 Tax=Nepenthes gracilis TaxID=150966 RepID=A0AAD3SXP2_NEPGR|nr:hypothetical protein Nepgr_020475 [Nepenthes gracilis]